MDEKYKKYLKSDSWNLIRDIVIERDGCKCTRCGSVNILQVHHKTYKNIFNEIEHLDDLITLCKSCHYDEHIDISNKHDCKVTKGIKRKDVDDMINSGVLDPNILYSWCKITKQINQIGQMKLLGAYINLEFERNIASNNVYMLGYTIRLEYITHHYNSFIMNRDRDKYISTWSELYDATRIKGNPTKLKFKKFLIDNNMIRVAKIYDKLNNKYVKRFIMNPFFYRGSAYSSQIAISTFQDFIKEDVNISKYQVLWLKSMDYINK